MRTNLTTLLIALLLVTFTASAKDLDKRERPERESKNTGWVDIEYNPSDFNDGDGSWIVPANSIRAFEYKVIDGDTMLLNFDIVNTEVAPGTSDLNLRLPAGYEAVGYTRTIIESYNYTGDNEYTPARAATTPGDTIVRVSRQSGGHFPVDPNTHIMGTLTLRVIKRF